jgi:prepilin-type N-terminal cleavage/methylation domain-containing protein
MQSTHQHLKWVRGGNRGFTVIELMLAVAILGIIIFALYSVFNETQRALRRSETNTDVAQKARALAEIIGAELEQAQPTRSFYLSNNIFVKEINMQGGLERQYVPADFVMNSSEPTIQPRTNFIHNIFFYNNRTNAWQGVGYRVVYFTNGVGALQRFETNIFGHKPFGNLGISNFNTVHLTNYAYRHIADGVVHLTFVPYDHNGRRMGWDTDNHSSAGYDTNQYYVVRRRVAGQIDSSRSDTTDTNLATVTLSEAIPTLPNTPNLQYTTAFTFMSNALPAYIEMEFGMLEPETLSRYYTMLDDQNPNAASFLQRQIGKVHLFRQRIPIRTAAQ